MCDASGSRSCCLTFHTVSLSNRAELAHSNTWSIVDGVYELEKVPKKGDFPQEHGPQVVPSHTGHRYPWPK
jgi:hypothetical protein